MDCLRESYFKPKTVFWGGGSMQTKSSLTVFDIKCLPYVLQLRVTYKFIYSEIDYNDAK